MGGASRAGLILLVKCFGNDDEGRENDCGGVGLGNIIVQNNHRTSGQGEQKPYPWGERRGGHLVGSFECGNWVRWAPVNRIY